MSSLFFLPSGLHNKLTILGGCQVLTVVKFYVVSNCGRAQVLTRVKFYGSCGSYISATISAAQNLKKLEIYDIIKG